MHVHFDISPQTAPDQPVDGESDTALHYIPFLGLGFCLLAAYTGMLSDTARMFASSDDLAHGLFAPFVSMYFAWRRRHQLSVLDGSAWGFVALIPAAIIGVLAAIGGSTTIARLAFLGSLAGCIVLTVGFRGFKRLIFPYCLLIFTFPIPQVLYGQLTLPLQILATKLSASSLELLGYSVLRQGNVLQLPHSLLSVVEACSGLRSLVTLLFFAVVFAQMFERSWKARVVLVAASIPTAILLNSVRITVSGVLSEMNPDYIHGAYHSVLGWASLFTGFFAVALVQKGITHASRAGWKK